MTSEIKKSILISLFTTQGNYVSNDGIFRVGPDFKPFDIFIFHKLVESSILLEISTGIDGSEKDTKYNWCYILNHNRLIEKIKSIDEKFTDYDWNYLLRLSRENKLNNILS